jgi:hypothetical protein
MPEAGGPPGACVQEGRAGGAPGLWGYLGGIIPVGGALRSASPGGQKQNKKRGKGYYCRCVGVSEAPRAYRSRTQDDIKTNAGRQARVPVPEACVLLAHQVLTHAPSPRNPITLPWECGTTRSAHR